FCSIMLFHPLSSQDLGSYRVEGFQKAEARSILQIPDTDDIHFPTDNEEAQWFPEAGLGLFMHWGIYSVAGVDPSWAMIKNCSWHVPRDKYAYYQDKGRHRYYALAEKFN